MERKRKLQTLFTAAACLTLSVLALLLWGKLKLVTGVPRRAYAEPRPKLIGKPAREVGGPRTAEQDGAGR